MSTQVLPTLAGQGWDVVRTPVWDTTVQTNVSGKETRIANQTYPRWKWDISFNVLRQGTVFGIAYTEMSQLAGFYNARQGQFDSFLYTDADDNSVTGQSIGAGDGTTTAFQLVRAFGSFVEPVLAPNVVSAVKINGVPKTLGTDYTVGAWGSSTAGVITFTTAPAASAAITADFTYYFPCRFSSDEFELTKFQQGFYSGKKLSFISLKN